MYPQYRSLNNHANSSLGFLIVNYFAILYPETCSNDEGPCITGMLHPGFRMFLRASAMISGFFQIESIASAEHIQPQTATPGNRRTERLRGRTRRF